jgi:hypothetical protein
MTKKTKKPKTPETKDGGNAGKAPKDAITGLYMEIPGALFESDKTTIVRPKALGIGEDEGEVTAEAELGNEYIVLTGQGGNGITRIVWKGEFEYNQKGRLNSALVTDIAQDWHPYPINDGGIISRYKKGSFQLVDPKGFARFDSVDQTYWDHTDTYRRWEHETEYSGEAVLSGTIDGAEVWSTGKGKDAITAFGEGRFFYDGWWTNPFAPNLI